MLKNIAVIGTGYVGLVSGVCFSEAGNHVICCDIDQGKINGLKRGIIPIFEPGLNQLINKNVAGDRLSFTSDIPEAIQKAEIIIIAVGTPMSRTGEADLTYIKQVAKTIGKHLNGYKIVVNKSTVPVGTGKMVKNLISEISRDRYAFDVVSNPEFLREGVAVKDTMQMERAVIGASSAKAMEVMVQLHQPFTTKVVKTTIESAEMIKYAANAFLATKISFMNDIANICERAEADVTKVSEGIGLDSRIGQKFLQAGVGFGGSCFPKDTAALLHIAESFGYDFKLIKAVMETNIGQRIQIIKKVESILGSLEGKSISILGLAFKPNTNDMRYAPALDIIPQLNHLGANVKTFDPIAIPEAKKQLGYICSYSDDLYETIQGTDACVILTGWKEIKNLDLEKTKRLMNQPLVVDGRNLFDLTTMQNLGFTYVSVGRPVVYGETTFSNII
nr:UDP-glucose/GDP-mannose dehydrogenase family protein [Terrilactibacillus laevilacticus]